MATDIYDLRRAQEKKDATVVKRRDNLIGEVIAVVGPDGKSTTSVYGRPGFVWVRVMGQSGGVFQCFYRGDPLVAATAVEIGYRYEHSQFIEVLDYNIDSYIGTGLESTVPALQKHGATHADEDKDPVWVYQRMVIPFRVFVVSGLKIEILPGVYKAPGGQIKYFPGYKNFNVAAYVPATVNRSVRVAVYLDIVTGNIGVLVGSESFLNGSPTVPRLPRDTVPITAVRLQTGQTTLDKNSDFIDLRGMFDPVIPSLPFTFVYADETSREAATGFTSADQYRLALQLDDTSAWILSDPAGPTWQPLGGGAPISAQFVVLATNATLTNERVLAVGTGMTLTDGGAGGNITIGLNISGLTEDATPDGAADFVPSLDSSTGTLRKVLMNNLPSVGAPVTAQYVVLALNASLANERVLTAGAGLALTDGGANGNVTLAVDINGLTADASPNGSADYVMTYNASAAANKKVLLNNLPGGSGGATLYAKVIDQKTAGTAGGTASSGTVHTRTLNTIVTDEIGISLSSNQITLPAGKYRCIIEAPAYAVDRTRAQLYNVTDSSITVLGPNAFARKSVSVTATCSVRGQFTIASSKTFEVRHYCESGTATQGLGVEINNGGNPEIYTVVELIKVA